MEKREPKVSLLKKLLGKSPQMNLENSKTLLVGLWNPHSKYSKTRHNIGADILERLIVQNSLEIKLDKSGVFKSGTLIIQENRVDVLIPYGFNE
jgi:peptidyl-tRNA hydrolase